MSAQYEVGERVDVLIRGARVAGTDRIGSRDIISVELGQRTLDLPLGTGVQVTRVAPKEWPPQQGDIWTAPGFGRWFARGGPGVPVQLTPESFNGPSERPEDLLRAVSGLRLAYREGWTLEPGRAANEPEPVDKRAETIAGLRELADWLDANPDVPADQSFEALVVLDMKSEDAERAVLLRIAEVMGVEPELNRDHPCVRKTFRGRVSQRVTYIPPKKPADQTTRAGDQVLSPEDPAVATTRPGHDLAPAGEEVGGPAGVSEPPTTPAEGALVWTATSREGLTYHAIGGSGRQTMCGRSMRTGHRLTPAEAGEQHGVRCPRCYPDGAA